jgi:hypothetical protein
MFPESSDPKTAMYDQGMILQTDPDKMIEAALQAYSQRLRNIPIKERLEGIKNDNEKSCEYRPSKI